eukprot:TRINITY_DN9815_c0_g1_i1.p1 TRINITY_DN9815_c0_g1~~TRINITY_DN9815_c0_g1_i1.p1  ORF type:complete len:372 (+),score=105.05 TRINITY_DN9815_c0_g1_i1:36-1151(+)
MVKKRPRKKAVSGRRLVPEADLPVANFVDSPEKRSRMRKSDSGNFKIMAKAVKEPEDVPDDWFDRDEEELVSETTNLIITTSPDLKPEVKIFTTQKYTQYPLDFWDLLSKYIKPEQVGTFALICKLSLSVVSGQSFWRSLYTDYFDPVAHNDLPVRLLPDSMSRPKGLRAGVIKMLHMTYTPFLEKQGRVSASWPDPHLLTGKVCLVNWSNKVAKKTVYYYFKLRDNVIKKAVKPCDIDEYIASDEEDDCIGDSQLTKLLISELSDITYNPEEGCRILQVSGTCWSAVPPVLGLKLLGVTLSVSHGMRFHKLKLQFGSPLSDCRRNADQQETTQVLIDNVCGMKVLDWWSPQYPRDGERRTTQQNIDHYGL